MRSDLAAELRAIAAGSLTYREAKKYASAANPTVRQALAEREDTPEELLYYLAADGSISVRRAVARNVSTPPAAFALLAADSEPSIRSDLAEKVARLAPSLADAERGEVLKAMRRALELLAKDHLVRVRHLIAEALRTEADAPASVVRLLAQDPEIGISGPVIELSPVLTDTDLLALIASPPVQGALNYLSKRKNLNAGISDALVDTGDESAIADLLGNSSAQIREETLDKLIDKAPEVPAWHRPLATRPSLPAGAGLRIARFVAAELISELVRRNHITAEEASRVSAHVDDQLTSDAETASAAEEPRAAQPTTGPISTLRAEALFRLGHLSAAEMIRGIEESDHDFVLTGLSLLSEVPQETIERALELRSAKGLVAIVWKSGLGVHVAERLQSRLAGLAPDAVLRGPGDGSYPLSDEEMEWTLEYLSD